MKLPDQLIQCLSKSVLCWLATTSKDLIPNVSPREIFAAYQEDSIIVANIASPQTVKNIKPGLCFRKAVTAKNRFKIKRYAVFSISP